MEVGEGEAGWAWLEGGGHGDGFVWVLLSALLLIILDVQEGGVEIGGLARYQGEVRCGQGGEGRGWVGVGVGGAFIQHTISY